MEDLFQIERSRIGWRLFRSASGWLLLLSLPFICFSAATAGKTLDATLPVNAQGAEVRPPPSPKPRAAKHAKLQVSGHGFLRDRQLRKVLQVLLLSGKKPEFYDANFVEDAALVLVSTVRRDGYLAPSLTAQLTLEDGRQLGYTWDEEMENPLPRPLRIRKIHFKIRKGVMYHLEELKIEGLTAIPEKKARAFFVETGLLLPLKRYRNYTPEKLRRGLSSLTDTLERQGYEQAAATISRLVRNDKTGAVKVQVQVQQGSKTLVRTVREEFFFKGESTPREVRTVFPGKPYSRIWQQDFTQALKTNDYHHGYPDATVEVRTLKREPAGAAVELDLLMEVRGGEQITLGKVKFEGEKRTKPSLLRERVQLKEGGLLDRIKVEQGRYRVAQLGVFDTVELSYETENENTRDVTYRVKEDKETDFSLLFGYGSYELLRGGVEVERRNIFGLAQHARLKVVQSFKASSGEFVYNIPELVGRDVDVFLNGTALRRQEVSFLRLEYGGGAGAHKYFKDIATDLSVRYNYQILNAEQVNGFVATEGALNPAVGAFITDLRHDRRDSPLYPHHGYKIFSNLESATRYLGGDVDYERLDLSMSYHQALGGGRWLHFGLSHGAAFAMGSSSNNLPFTRRFFPGGENSIRGFQEGRASPRDAQGRYLGAETYILGTVEFEQALTPKWSLVLFTDSLGEARQIQHYPGDTALYSVGAGFSWHTLLGPIRLEYGHNLNRRSGDSAGTLHFSLGFPF